MTAGGLEIIFQILAPAGFPEFCQSLRRADRRGRPPPLTDPRPRIIHEMSPDEIAAMLRLKELEALETIAGKVERLTVHNGTEGLMTDLVKLRD